MKTMRHDTHLIAIDDDSGEADRLLVDVNALRQDFLDVGVGGLRLRDRASEGDE